MRLLAALSLLLGLAGCDTHAVGDDELETLVVTMTSEGVLVETLDDYPCSNFVLDLDADVRDDALRIRVRGIESTEICATMLGPASGFVETPVAYGSRVELEKGGAVDRYDYVCGFIGCELRPVGRTTFSVPGPREFVLE